MKLKVIFLIVALCWGVSSQAQQLPIVKYDIDKVTAKWNNMEARLTIDADYPDGNTPNCLSPGISTVRLSRVSN